MKKAILAILIISLIVSCKDQNTSETVKSIEKNIPVPENPTGLSGKNFEYNYGAYIYVLNFTSDTTLHWKCIKGDEIEQGREADETYYTQHLKENIFFISWIESDGLGVSQVVNLKENAVNTFLMEGKEVSILSGTIREI